MGLRLIQKPVRNARIPKIIRYKADNKSYGLFNLVKSVRSPPNKLNTPIAGQKKVL